MLFFTTKPIMLNVPCQKMCFFQTNVKIQPNMWLIFSKIPMFFLRIPPDILTTCLSVGPSPNDSTAGSQGAIFFMGFHHELKGCYGFNVMSSHEL